MQDISIYDSVWGMFLSIHQQKENIFEIRIKNCQDDILLFSIKTLMSPLYVISISTNQGAVTPGQQKIVIINIMPTIDINSITIPLNFKVVLASTSIQQIYRLYEVDMDTQSLISNFKGRLFNLIFPPRKQLNSTQMFNISEIELLEDFGQERHLVKDINLNVEDSIQKAYQILFSRLQYSQKFIKNITPEIANQLHSFAQNLLKFKVSLDYWAFLDSKNRIDLLFSFLNFLKKPNFCPICGFNYQQIYCGICGCYLACCESHSNDFSKLHYAECYDLSQIQILKVLSTRDLESVILVKNGRFNDQKIIETEKNMKQKEDWIFQAQDVVEKTQNYLNEICTFGLKNKVQEVDEGQLEEMIKSGKREPKPKKSVNIEKEVNAMMKILDNVQEEKQKFKKYISEKYGTSKSFNRNIAINEKECDGDNIPPKKLEKEIETIIGDLDKDAPVSIYQQIIERVLNYYNQNFQHMKNQDRTLKKYVYTYQQESGELYEALKEEYKSAMQTIASFGDPNSVRLQILTDDDKTLEIIALMNQLEVFIKNKKEATQIYNQQELVGQKLIQMEIMTQQSNNKYQQLDTTLKQKRVEHFQFSTSFQSDQQKLQKIIDYNSQLQEMIKCLETSVYDQDGYWRMMQQGNLDFQLLKQPKYNSRKNSRSNSNLNGSDSNSSFASSMVNDSGFESNYDGKTNVQGNENIYFDELDQIPNQKLTIQDIQNGLLINSPQSSGKTLAININLADTNSQDAVNVTIYDSLENMTRLLVQYAEQFNQIVDYGEDAYFVLQDISTKCYSQIYVNMARVLQKKLLDFDQQEYFDFKDIITVKRRLNSLQFPYEFKQYLKQWMAIQEEYEKLQQAIERQIWYCIAYSPEVLNSYPKQKLHIPIINFGTITQAELALVLDGVQDL